MKRTMLKSKIHRATVTDADIHYEGSITIDKALMDAADIIDYEKVAVWNVDLGTRFETYVIQGEPGSGVICVNGAAARLVGRGDKVIIASFVEMDEEEAKKCEPRLIFVDDNNRIKKLPTDLRLTADGEN